MNQWIRKTDAADHMREVTKSGVTYLTFPVLDATGIVTHAFSTRMGGVSEGWYSTMNFSFTRGDNREHVLENYSRMAAALGVDREKNGLNLADPHDKLSESSPRMISEKAL